MNNLKSTYRFTVGFLAIIFILLSCKPEADNSPVYSEMEMEILQLINQYRIIQGLETLDMNNFLFEEASQHSIFMIESGEISHENSSDRFDRIQSELGSSSFAENVAFGQKTANEVVNAWLTSEGHRQNIEGKYNLTGISAKRNSEGKYYYTQIFTQIP